MPGCWPVIQSLKHIHLNMSPFPFSSGRWVFGQVYPEHLVCPVPSLHCHCFHRPLAALQRGRKAVPWRRPPVPNWLLASSQENLTDHPKRNLCECLIDTFKLRNPGMPPVIYFSIPFLGHNIIRDLPGFLLDCWRCLLQISFWPLCVQDMINKWCTQNNKRKQKLKN